MADEIEPDAPTQTTLIAAATTGNDLDLPAAQRRSRPDPLVDTDGTALVQGDLVRIQGGGRARVIGHARGRFWILLAWVEDGGAGARAFGSYLVQRVRKI